MNSELAESLSLFDPKRAPAHVGIIMDGNGRWAEENGFSRVEGHKEGVERVRELIPFSALELRLQTLTLYIFSIENWQRPPEEIEALMVILEYFLTEEISKLIRDNIQFTTCGDTSRLPTHIQELIEDGKRRTGHCTGMILNAALSYGGRDEIVRAVRKLISSGIPAEEVTETTLANALDTAKLPEPDLIIRTSGEFRTSNFLLWQSAYSEFYFTKLLWPEFNKLELVRALLDYQHRDRRYGAISDRKP